MPVVPAARLSRPHSNNAVLLWTGGENIRFFAAAGWPVFRKTSAVRAEQQETMQAVSGQFSSCLLYTSASERSKMRGAGCHLSDRAFQHAAI